MEKRISEYVQYGCGYESHPKEWTNFDASPTLFLQRIPFGGRLVKKIIKPLFPDNVRFGDIVKGLPIQGNSCKGIYCSHILEHLSLNDFRIALKNTYDYLKPNGIFRLVMPDLFSLAQKYVKSDDPDSSIIFFKESLLGVTKRERSLGVFLRNYLGSSQHLWLWDFKSVKKELENIGFKQIQQAHFGDSQDPKFHEVEDKSRWDDCLGIECVK